MNLAVTSDRDIRLLRDFLNVRRDQKNTGKWDGYSPSTRPGQSRDNSGSVEVDGPSGHKLEGGRTGNERYHADPDAPPCRHCGEPTHFHSQAGTWLWFRCLVCGDEENYSLTVVKPEEQR